MEESYLSLELRIECGDFFIHSGCRIYFIELFRFIDEWCDDIDALSLGDFSKDSGFEFVIFGFGDDFADDRFTTCWHLIDN